MISPSSILVDVDALAPDQAALDHARELAIGCGARLKVVDVLPHVPSSARHFVTAAYEEELVTHRSERLASLAMRVTDVEVTTELLRGRPATALVGEVLAGGHDVLVRSHARDLADQPGPYGPVDMELMRVCPCPVWLIGPQPSPRSPWRVVAAINPNPDDPIEQQLNVTLVDWGLMLRNTTGADFTLLHAWSLFGGSVLRSRLPEAEFLDYLERARRVAQDTMNAFTRPLAARLQGVSIQLVQGDPERAIPRFVVESGADLVIIGTVARSGLPGLLMGNTAERVLQRLRGSVLAIKPPGFVSPVSKE